MLIATGAECLWKVVEEQDLKDTNATTYIL